MSFTHKPRHDHQTRASQLFLAGTPVGSEQAGVLWAGLTTPTVFQEESLLLPTTQGLGILIQDVGPSPSLQ